MIVEQAILHIKPGKSTEFESAFKKAQKIITSIKGYIRHDLLKCHEQIDTYLLLVEWQSIEDHEIGFRQSEEYQEWKTLLHHFYDPFPVVHHYQSILN